MTDFQSLLQTHFGFNNFRPGQSEVLEALETQKAALAVFPTGAGKSLCYQLPALAFDGLTLVVSPLIALMKDQIDFLQSKGIAAARLDSTLSSEEAFQVQDQARNGQLKLLYVAPERFNNERFLSLLERTPIALFAVDEAHCISEWGHNFRPDYMKLAEAAQTCKAQRVLALTATATPHVVEEICAGFGIPRQSAIITGFYRENLSLCTTPVPAPARDALLLKRLSSRPPGPTIVYVTLQRTAEIIAQFLESQGLPARPYHAGMDSESRAQTQEWWMAGDDRIVVATIAFGMGIDKANVRYVYHYNLPKSLESYSQEIGRAGRDNQKSIVELFACRDDVPTLENFAYGDTPERDALQKLVEEILNLGPEFALDQNELSTRLDIRPLVLRTALTYLELFGVLKQGTPFYAGYAYKFSMPPDEILQQFPGEPGQFVQSIFEASKQAKIWNRLNPDEAAETLNAPRKRIVRALEVLHERELIHLTSSDVRQRYIRLRENENIEELVNELSRRFDHREAREIERLGQVLELIELDSCQTNFLVSYFGEERQSPCGHCSFCRTGQEVFMPDEEELPPLPDNLNLQEWATLCGDNPEALGLSRQKARFLCGLSSPALSKAKLPRHALFGIWHKRPFADVLEWVTMGNH
jgi:ATP-dependent DNA helicase RecQ